MQIYLTMNQYKTLYKNTLIFTISNFASKILGFFMLPLYTRVLSKEEFGSTDLITLTVGLLMPILTISIAEGVLRFALDENEDKSQVFTFGLKLITSSFILMLMLFPLISMIPIIKNYIILFYLIYISQALNLFFNQFMQGINKIKLIGIVGVIQTIITVASNIILLVVFKLGIKGFLLSIIIANTIALLTLFIFGELKRYINLLSPINKNLKHEMLRYCIPLTPNRLSWWLNNSANKYIISAYCGVSELGLFSAASRIPSILTTFQGIFIQAWQLSAITEYDKKYSVDFFSKIYKLYNFTMLLGCSLLILFIRPVSSILFGVEFSKSWKLAPFLLISVIFGALIGFLNSLNLAVKKTKSLFISVLIGASLGIILNFIFVPTYGAMAASIINTISFFTIWLIRLIDVQKYMHLKISYLQDFLSYIIVIIQSIIVIAVNNQHNVIYTSLCTLLICIINKEIILDLLNYIWFKTKKIRKKC